MVTQASAVSAVTLVAVKTGTIRRLAAPKSSGDRGSSSCSNPLSSGSGNQVAKMVADLVVDELTGVTRKGTELAGTKRTEM